MKDKPLIRTKTQRATILIRRTAIDLNTATLELEYHLTHLPFIPKQITQLRHRVKVLSGRLNRLKAIKTSLYTFQ